VQVGILGAGRFGGAAAAALARAGHQVFVSNRRGRVALMPLVEEIGSGVVPARPEEAARAAVLLLAVPWGAVEELLEELGDLGGRVLIDATNAWGGWEPHGDEAGSSEAVARMARGARVVKALNTVHAGRLAGAGTGLPVAGDDPEAVATVCGIATRMGFAPVPIGPLRAGRVMEPGGALFGAYVGPDEVRALASVALGDGAPPAA
jgi:predicted dinucleotide-binding enzyme